MLAIVLSGCGRKQPSQEQITREAEASLPPEERAAPLPPEPRNKDSDLLKEPDPASPKPAAASPPLGSGDISAYEAWFKKYHLDLNDPKMLDADPDGDGFTNREEFLAGTDPLDPNSHPPTVAARSLIKLKEYNEVRLPVVLEAVEGDKARLKRVEGSGESRVETVRAGDTIHGLPLIVEKVESKQDVDKNGDPVDLSRVILTDSATREKVVLMKDLPAKTSASYALLSSPDGKISLKVHHGDVFTWPGEPGATYKVVDLSRDQVVLEQVENKKMWTIPRM